MKWPTLNLFRKMKKSPGFQDKCKEGKKILESMPNDVSEMAAAEEGLACILDDYDQITREGLYTAIEHIINARQKVRFGLLGEENLLALEQQEPILHGGLIARNIVELLTKGDFVNKISSEQYSAILLTIITRLSLELNEQAFQELTNKLLPEGKRQNIKNKQGFMFQ